MYNRFMSNPAHTWLAMAAANRQYDRTEGFGEQMERFHLAQRMLAGLPAEVVAAAEAEGAGQLTFEEVG